MSLQSSRDRRIMKELQDIRQDQDKSGVMAYLVNDGNLTYLKGTFPGPPGTPYDGGTYIVDIQIPDNYPFKSPIIKFNTKIWHPNISSQTGAICLDTLGSSWSPVGTIKMALLSLRMLLESPNPKDPQDAEVAKMMMEDVAAYHKKAHEWAVTYAGAPQKEERAYALSHHMLQVERKPDDPSRYQGYHKDLIDRFVNMGFELDRVVEAFNYYSIDRNGGEDYELEEAYMGDITARLFGEP